jgi:hypothetical protein
MYASLFGILGALHLDVFEQPEEHLFFSNLIELLYLNLFTFSRWFLSIYRVFSINSENFVATFWAI